MLDIRYLKEFMGIYTNTISVRGLQIGQHKAFK